MLYATTRSDRDVYTAQRALTRDQGPEGGLYVPYRAQKLSGETLRRLEEKKDLDILASAVNALFGTRLTAWDVEFTVGRKPLRLKSLNRKTLAGERWHNPKIGRAHV